jgi:hypothetical protein
MPLDPRTGLHRPWTREEAAEATRRSHVTRQRNQVALLERRLLDFELDPTLPAAARAHFAAMHAELRRAAEEAQASGLYSEKIYRIGLRFEDDRRKVRRFRARTKDGARTKTPWLSAKG